RVPSHFGISTLFHVFCLFIFLFILIDGWVKRCSCRIGRCRQSCKENEKKKEKCGPKRICCFPDGNTPNPKKQPPKSSTFTENLWVQGLVLSMLHT
uniref:Beta-defensin n=1 Tax=Felis catus TaxID=9685 RepID=A0ABI8AED3_FELCA